jgi:anaerobic selenocysteine-containing dehydrogenase/Fe-S-cluster-containing dehydrogenase component
MSDGMKRRDFLKVAGVSGAAATTVGCTTGEVQRLIPYVIPSEEIVPGVPTWYSSTCRECPAGCGVLVETHSGRATKVEGNPDHPINRGNLCARGQASVQGLYHPDRYSGPMTREGVQQLDVTWGTAERILADEIRRLQQAGRAGSIVYLSQAHTGTMDRLVNEFVGNIGARRVVFDEWADQPRGLDFSGARTLVSFGADFLETWGSPVEYAWQFAQMHSYRDGQKGRFVWVGPHRPLTGLNADEWIAPRPGTEVLVAAALAGQMDLATAARESDVPQETLLSLAQEFQGGNAVALGPGKSLAGANQAQLRQAIAQLNRGRAQSPTAPAQNTGRQMVQLVEQMRAGQIGLLLIDGVNPAYALPGALGFAEAMASVPFTVSFSSFPDDTARLARMILPDHHFLEAWGDYEPTPGMFELVQPVMRPVFNTKQTGDVLLSVTRALGTQTEVGTYYDYLRSGWQGVSGGDEGWRDALRRGGVFQAATPVGADTPGVDAAAGAAGAAGTAAPVGGALVGGATLQPAQPVVGASPPQTGAGRESPGAGGMVPGTLQEDLAGQTIAPGPQPFGPLAFQGAQDANFHLVVYPSYRFFDGRTANRPWLLELPDPVTKVSWDSWVEIHPAAAAELGVRQGDWMEVTSPFGTVEVPAYVYPGVRPDTVAIQMGLGHEAFGRFTQGRGVNANRLLGPTLDETGGTFASYGLRVRVQPTGRRAKDTQGIFNPGPGLFEQGVRVQHDREIAQAVSVAALMQLDQQGEGSIPGEDTQLKLLRGKGGFAPAAVTTDPAQFPMHGSEFGEYIDGMTRWGMVVDLDRCIGCSACVVACYAENNIPVVGPTEVKRGRALHWLRIERYWGVSRHPEEAMTSEATNDTRFLPMLCQHCSNAPCEPVCPVYAAYHTPDGLNGQVYNRCVGTRYCANNCPWKVRYFNWFTYEYAEPLNWQLNPDVTVREKGVMEKCTFCVQRIREAEHVAARENRPVRDGDVVPACVQTCPTEVFVFGNFADPNSAVTQAARSNRSYRTYEELNFQPAIVYLQKVTHHEPARGGHHAPAGAGYGPTETH